jgi:hypothetical protein
LLGSFGRCHNRSLSHMEVSFIKCLPGAAPAWILRECHAVDQLEIPVARAVEIRQFDGDGRARAPWGNAPELPWRCLRCGPCLASQPGEQPRKAMRATLVVG